MGWPQCSTPALGRVAAIGELAHSERRIVRRRDALAPYGGARYSNGVMPTDYGFTGQHSDAATGLDDSGARYYDPLAGQFISADTLLPGNGMDPWGLSRYAYVEGNPLIRVDPTGHDGGWLGGLVSAVTSTVSSVASTVARVAQAAGPVRGGAGRDDGIPAMINDAQTIFSGNASTLDKIMAGADILTSS